MKFNYEPVESVSKQSAESIEEVNLFDDDGISNEFWWWWLFNDGLLLSDRRISWCVGSMEITLTTNFVSI